MTVLKFSEQYPDGIIVEEDNLPIDNDFLEETSNEKTSDQALNEFFSGLSTASTIAQIRELAKKFVNDTNNIN